MRLTVRLSIETLTGIRELKKIYEEELGGLKINLGDVVNKSYANIDIKWEEWVDINNQKIKLDYSNIEDTNEQDNNRTTLDLSEEVINVIKEMKEELPQIFKVSRVTTGFCIKLIVKAALIKYKN